MKTLNLTKEAFQNKYTSVQSRLGEHGPLNPDTSTTPNQQIQTNHGIYMLTENDNLKCVLLSF